MKTNIFKKILKVVAGSVVALALVFGGINLLPQNDDQALGQSMAGNNNVSATASITSFQDLLVRTTLANSAYSGTTSSYTKIGVSSHDTSLDTNDYVWLPSYCSDDDTDIRNMLPNSNAGRQTTGTDFDNAMYGTSNYYWLRSISNDQYFGACAVRPDGAWEKRSYNYADHHIRPAIQINLAMVLSKKSELGIVINTANSTITIPQVMYPQTIVTTTSDLTTALTAGRSENKNVASNGLIKTGVKYSTCYWNQPGYKLNDEYFYEGNYYIYAGVYPGREFSNGETIANYNFAWFKVEPIVWHISNLSEILDDINNNNTSTTKTMYAISDQKLVNVGAYHANISEIGAPIWQNSRVRAYLNGYNLATENLTNGNQEYNTTDLDNAYYDFSGEGMGFLQTVWHEAAPAKVTFDPVGGDSFVALQSALNVAGIQNVKFTSTLTIDDAFVSANGSTIDFKGKTLSGIGINNCLINITTSSDVTIANANFADCPYGAIVSTGTGKLNVQNCTFTNCYVDYEQTVTSTTAVENQAQGGAIKVTGDLRATNCTFTGCYAKASVTATGSGVTATVSNLAQGGAIYAKPASGTANVELTNCTFDGCYAQYAQTLNDSATANGSITCAKGVIFVEGSLTLNNCTVQNCTKTLIKSSGALTMAGCHFNTIGDNWEQTLISCQGAEISGCVFNTCKSFNSIINSSSTTLINNSEFVDCACGRVDTEATIYSQSNATIKNTNFIRCNGRDSRGGAIQCRTGSAEIEKCKFEGCYAGTSGGGAIYATTANVYGCKFDGCHASSAGGAINATTLNLYDSEFVGCYANSGNAGAIKCNSLYGSGNRFTNCYAESYGGAIYVSSGGVDVLEISDSIFDNCYSTSGYKKYEGGAIYATNGKLRSITNCQFYNCRVATAKDTGDVGYGGAVCISNESYTNPGACSADVSIVGCVFGKWVDADGDGVVDENEDEIFGNKANYGGACYINTTGNVTIDSCSFVGNDYNYSGASADKYYNGSVLYLPGGNGSNFVLSNCVFEHNGAKSTNNKGFSGISAVGYNCTITDCIFDDFGGDSHSAFYLEGSTYNLVMKNCKITNNSAGLNDIVSVAFNKLFFESCDFISNYKYEGQYKNNSNRFFSFVSNKGIDFINCNFIDNDGYSAGDYSYMVYTQVGTSLTQNVENCVFDNNRNFPVVLWFYNNNDVSVKLSNTKFSNNSVNNSVVYVNINNNDAATVDKGDRLYVEDCTFSGNSGRALYAGAHINTIKNSTFSNNTLASGNGAAINLPKATQLNSTNIVDNCVFNGNSAANGGAIVSNDAILNLTNSLFNDNTTTGDGHGGAIYMVRNDAKNGRLNATNCQFYGNRGVYGGAIRLDCAGGYLTNCLFENNRATSGGAVHVYAAGVYPNGCEFYNNYASSYGGAMYDPYFGTITNCLFKENCAGKDGGVIYTQYKVTIRQGTQIVGNYCETGNGAGIHFHGGGGYIEFSTGAKPIVIDGNYGGATWDSTNNKVTAYDETKSSNVYNANGAVISISDSTLDVSKANLFIGYSIAEGVLSSSTKKIISFSGSNGFSSALECVRLDQQTITIASGANAGNYSIEKYFNGSDVYVKLIKQGSANIEYVASSFNGVYDGLLHSIDVKVISPANYTITYSKNENGTYNVDFVEGDTAFKNVTGGAKTIWFKITADGYEDVKSTATVNIVAVSTKIILSSATITADFGTSFNTTTSLNNYLTGAFVVDSNGNNVAGDFYFSANQTMRMSGGTAAAFSGNLTFKPSNPNFAAPSALTINNNNNIARKVIYTNLWYNNGNFYSTQNRATGEDTTYRTDAKLSVMLKFLPANATVYFLSGYTVSADETIAVGQNNWTFTKLSDTYKNTLITVASGMTLTITTSKLGRLTICGAGTATDNAPLIANSGTIDFSGNIYIKDNNITTYGSSNADRTGAGINGSGVVKLDGVVLSGLTAVDGGAIYAGGNITLKNTTISGCTVNSNNNVVYAGGTATIEYSTISGNSGSNRTDVKVNGAGESTITGSNIDSIEFAGASGTINLSGLVSINKLSYKFWESASVGFAVYNKGLLLGSTIKLKATNTTVVGTYALRTNVYSLDGIYGKIFSLLNTGTGGLGISGGFIVVLATSSGSSSEEEEDEDESVNKIPLTYYGVQGVEYIESTGTAYIDTGYTANNTTAIKVKFMVLPRAGNQHRVYGGSTKFLYYPDVVFWNDGLQFITEAGTETINEIYHNKNRVYFNDSLCAEFSDATWTDSTSITLFMMHTQIGNQSLLGRMYECKIWNDGTLVRNLVPSVATKPIDGYNGGSNTGAVAVGTVGMFDTVNKRFYINSGSTSFVASSNTIDYITDDYYTFYWDPANTSGNAADTNSGTQYAPVASLDRAVSLAKQYGAVVKQLSTLTVSSETTLDFGNVVLGRGAGFADGNHITVSTTDEVTIKNVRVDGNYTNTDSVYSFRIATNANANVNISNVNMKAIEACGIKFEGNSGTNFSLTKTKIKGVLLGVMNDYGRCVNISGTTTATLTNCDISGRAQVYCDSGTLNINYCNLHDNGEIKTSSTGNKRITLHGGAVKAATVVANNSTFSNNGASTTSGYGAAGWGGAIYASKVTATNCTFTGNRTFENGAQHGGGAMYVTGNVEVENCKFYDHACYGGSSWCGTIYCGGTLKATDCIFTKSYTTTHQGTIYAKNGINIKNTTIDQTNCGGRAGFLETNSNPITAINCSFTNSSCGNLGINCSDLTMENCVMSGNTGSAGISATGNVSMKNTTITGVSGGGNVVYVGGATASFDNCLMSNNTFSNGAVIYQNAANGVLTITNTQITNNSSTSEGSNVIRANQATSTVTIANSNISGNTVSGKYDGTAVGGVVSINGTLTMTNSHVENNTSAYAGGTAYGGVYVKGNATIKNSTINGNITKGNNANSVGGLYVSGTATLENVEVCYNTSTYGIGGLSTGAGTWLNVTIGHNTGSTGGAGTSKATKITNCDICYNTTTLNDKTAVSGLRQDASATFLNCNIYGNKNGNCAGVESSSTQTYRNCKFYGNSSSPSSNDYAAVVLSKGSTKNVYNCKFYDNYSSNMTMILACWAYVYSYNTEFYNNNTSGIITGAYNMENCSVHNNNGSTFGSYGNASAFTVKNSAFYANKNFKLSAGTNFTIKDCEIYNNFSSSHLIECQAYSYKLNFENNRVFDNISSNINSNVINAVTTYNITELYIFGNYISGNEFGSIVNSTGKITTFENNVFANNKLTSSAYGVVYLPNGSTINGCVFYGNTNVSTGADSPIIVVDSGITVTFDNCLFYENASLGTGASATKIFKVVGTANFVSCQFANNYYYKSTLSTTKKLAIGGVFVDGGVANIDNCDITLNPTTDLPFGSYGMFYVNGGELNLNGTFEGIALGDGNLIVVNGGVANITAEITGNAVDNGIIVVKAGQLNIVDSLISGNTATQNIILQTGGDITIENSVVLNNTSTNGSVISQTGGSAEVTASAITGNTAKFGTIYAGGEMAINFGSGILGAYSYGIYSNTGVNGGAICVGNDGMCLLVSGTIKENTAVSGGAIYVENGGLFTLLAGTIGENNTATGTNADQGGGAMFVASGGKAVINGGEVKGNKAKFGAGIYNAGTLVINDGKIWNNMINALNGMGGGIYNTGVATINYVQLLNNSSSLDANYSANVTSALAIANSGTLTMLGGVMENNSHAPSSATIYCLTGGQTTIDGVTFSNNANCYGGAINLKENSMLVLRNSTFNLPTSYTHPSGTNGKGAALYLSGNFNVENCLFSGTDTSKTKYDGAVWIEATASGTIDGCVFENIYFNGLTAFGGTVGASKKVEILNCTIDGCRRDTTEGINIIESNGLLVIDNLRYINNKGKHLSCFTIKGGGEAIVSNSLFEGNSTNDTLNTSAYCAGLYLGGTATKLINNCVFKHNKNSTLSNSTLYIANSAQNVTIKDCTFEENENLDVIYVDVPNSGNYIRFVGNNTIQNNIVGKSGVNINSKSGRLFYSEIGFGGKLVVYNNTQTAGNQANLKAFSEFVNNKNGNTIYCGRYLVGGLAKGSKIGLTISSGANSDLFVGTNPISTADFECFVSDVADYALYLDATNNIIKYSAIASTQVVASGLVTFANGYYQGLTDDNFAVYQSGVKLGKDEFVVTYSTQTDGIYTLVSPQYAVVSNNTVYYKVYLASEFDPNNESTPYASGSIKVVVAKRYLSALTLPSARVDVGAELSTAVITGGQVVDNFGSPVAGTWAFADGTQIATSGGKYGVTFTPNVAGVYSNENAVLGTIGIDYKYDLLVYKVVDPSATPIERAFFSGTTKTSITSLEEATTLVANGGRIVFDTTYTFTNSEDVKANSKIYISKGANLRGNMFVVSDEVLGLAVTFSGNIVFDGSYSEETKNNLPSAYQEVEYIENISDNYNLRYIDTGIYPDSSYSVKMVFSTSVANGYENNLCGSWSGGFRIGAGYNTLNIWNGEGLGAYGTGYNKYASPGGNENTIITLEVDNNSYTLNGNKINCTPVANYTTLPNSLIIFALHDNSGVTVIRNAKAKLYEYKIFKDSQMIMNLVPCYHKSTGRVGLYDLVTGTFFDNAASATVNFEKGPEVGTHVWGAGYDDRTQEVLDSGLLPVEYIQNTSANAYIQTKLNVNKGDTFDVVGKKLEFKATMMFGQNGGWETSSEIFGLGPGGSSGNGFGLTARSDPNWAIRRGGRYWAGRLETNTKYDIDATWGAASGVSLKVFDYQTDNIVRQVSNTTSNSMKTGISSVVYARIFSSVDNNSNAGSNNLPNIKFYGGKIYLGEGDNNLVYDFIPAYDPTTGKAGLYDLVSHEFLTSAGSANFGHGDFTTIVTEQLYPEYITINGNNNYIDTGVAMVETSKIEVKISGTDVANNGMIINTSWSNYIQINSSGWSYNGYTLTGSRSGDAINNISQLFDGNVHTIAFKDYKINTDSTSVKIHTGHWGDNANGRTINWYGMRIWDKSGNLIRDYKPYIRPNDGKPGFYDLITNTFVTCTSTAGPLQETYTINNSSILNNCGLFRIKEGSTLNLESGVKIENWARTDGYAYIYNQGALNISGATFANNSVTSSTDDAHGGLVLNTGTVNINSGTFVNNKVEGANMAFGGIVCNAGGVVNISGGTFADNKITATNGGYGAVVFNTNGGNTNIYGGEFVRNSANYGGVVSNGVGTLCFAGGTMSLNSVTEVDGGAVVNGKNVDGISSIIYLGGEVVANSILANGQVRPVMQNTVEVAGTNYALWACIMVLLGMAIAFAFWRVLVLKKKYSKNL